MVYFVDGKRFEGSKPSNSVSFNRSPSVFAKFDIEAAKNLFWEADEAASPKRQKLAGPKYHLYIAAACPWAHRASLVRALLKLEQQVSLSVVETIRDDKVGWAFGQQTAVDEKMDWGSAVVPSEDRRGTGYKYLYEVYLKGSPEYTGNITTPVLIDSQGAILSNESWDVARALVVLSGQKQHPLYPLEGEGAEARRAEIDQIARTIHDDFNNGVYRSGLAKAQGPHEQAAALVHATLDLMEERLGHHRYLLPGEHPTLADWQFFASLIRFDSVYGPLFKCMLRRLTSYNNIYNYVCDLLQNHPEIKPTIYPRDINRHYWTTFTSSNPNGVVSYDDCIEKMSRFPHNRAEMEQKQRNAMVDKASAEQDQANKAQEQAKGNFVRGVSGFRNWITPGGTFDVEAGRYHLYVAANCPWCHRVMLGRSVMGLENVISMDLLFYRRNEEGFWQFLPEEKDLRDFERGNQDLIGGVALADSIHGKKTVPEIYPAGSTEKSVPILYDKKLNVIVNNESSEILRMFGTVFAPLSQLPSKPPALYPAETAWLIEEINTWVYTDIANGAYRAGFSSVQETYEQARATYFAGLQRADDILSRRKFLCGENITEADVRLFPPIYRHDPVYYMRMKLTTAMVRDFPNLQRWLTQMLQVPGVKEASRIQHCLHGYFGRTGAGLVPTIVLRRDVWY